MVHKAHSDINRRKFLYLVSKKMEGKHVVVFDTETTGTDCRKDYVIQFAFERYVVKNGELVSEDSGSIYIRPPFRMEKKVIKVHGITNEFLADKPNENEAFEKIRKIFDDQPAVVGHNIEFDLKMLGAMYKRQKKILYVMYYADTLPASREVLLGEGIDNYKLKTITEYLGLDAGIDFHKADSDVRATSRILSFCINEYKNSENFIPDEQKEKLILYSVGFWDGYNKSQKGLYIKTNINYIKGSGSIYYSVFDKCWCSSKFNISEYNLSDLEKSLLKKLCIPSMSEAGRMTKKKFDALMEENKMQKA